MRVSYLIVIDSVSVRNTLVKRDGICHRDGNKSESEELARVEDHYE